MATIKDVAKYAGVSISTVSRTLSGCVPVEEETREAVMKAVKELEYKPNAIARGLKKGRSKTLALILPSIMNPFYPKVFNYVDKFASEKGYVTLLLISNGNPQRERQHFELAKSRYVDGVILISSTDNTEHLESLRNEGLPLVLVNRMFDIEISSITNDNRKGAYDTVSYLIAQGHRKICCMGRDLSMQHYRQRYEGCIDAFRDHRIDGYERFMAEDVKTAEIAFRITRELLDGPDAPTAFFVFSDIIAEGVYSGVSYSGKHIPEDISVAGFDNINNSQYMIPPLTTYDHPIERIAERAVDILIKHIDAVHGCCEAFDPIHEIVEGSLVIRSSVGKVKQ